MGLLNIIIFTDWYYPAYKAGGPITSLKNLVYLLEDKIDIFIVTSAYDLGENKLLKNIEPDTWQKKSEAKIKYLTNPSKAVKELENMDYDYDYVYLNSMFSPSFTLKPLLKARRNGLLHKVILAPRGMLAEGALSLKAPKKKIFLKFFKLLGFSKKIIFHATSEQEVTDIKRMFGRGTNIKLIPNFPGIISEYSKEIFKVKNELKLISVARIAEEKNTLFLLELLNRLKGNVTLNLFGMIKSKSYLNSCNKVISNLPSNIKVHINGDVPSYEVKNKLNENHFFILPTLGENFGHAIYESLSTGSPVIISDKTPWKNLEQSKAGWDISLDNKSRFIEVLNKCVAMDQEEYEEWSTSAYNYSKKYYEENDLTEKYLGMFGLNVT